MLVSKAISWEQKFGVTEDTKLVGTPLTDEEKMKMESVPYVNFVGGLMYVMICTCPNITHVAVIVSRFMFNPGREHWNAAKWILRYQYYNE